jgi:membrane protein DedA with SNARE-associated domain
MEQHVFAWVQQYGYLAIFLLLCWGIIGLPIPDETLLAFSGFLVYSGKLSLPLAYCTALAGSSSGITISFWLGRTYGLKLIRRYGRYVHITEERIARAHRFFEGFGHWALTFGYFVPGVRHVTAFAAGMSDLEPHLFGIFAYAGACLWIATFMGIGYLLGERWREMEKHVHGYLMWAVLAATGIGIAVYLVWRARGRKRAN